MSVIPRGLAVLAATVAATPGGAFIVSPASGAPVAAPDGTVGRAATVRTTRALGGPDPRLADAWHLASDAAMGVRTAWRRGTGGDIVVATLDTGIDTTHPDLVDNLWTNPGEIPGNGIDDDADGTIDDVHGVDLVNRDGDPSDDNGHGTHVAGIIGARGDNGIGAAGVAWRVRLMAVKVLDERAGGTTNTVASGLRWAIRHGARIINLSLAGDRPSPELEAAIVAAQQAGVLVVVAAGNGSQNLSLVPSYPASYLEPNVLAVSATREDGALAKISNFGAGVDLSAPGDTIFSTAMGGGYEYRTGTSMAAPMVAGAAALLLAAAPALDAPGLMAALAGSARKTGLLVGAGALDVGAALGGPLPSSSVPAAGTAPVTVAVAVTAGTARRTPPAKSSTARARAKAKARAKARATAKARASRRRAAARRSRSFAARPRNAGSGKRRAGARARG